MTDESANDADAIVLPEDFRAANTVQNLLSELKSVASDKPIVLDASKVSGMTTPAVVALLAVLEDRKDQTPPVTVVQPTDTFVDAFSELGLFQNLMQMEFRS